MTNSELFHGGPFLWYDVNSHLPTLDLYTKFDIDCHLPESSIFVAPFKMNWYWILGWIPSTFAILGNGSVIYLIYTRRRLRTVPNRFVLSLALADFGVGACFFPAHFICNFRPSNCNSSIADDIAVLTIYSSTTNLCAMTVDRYLATVRPLTYTSLMTARRAEYFIAC